MPSGVLPPCAAIVVLGCGFTLDEAGLPGPGALSRRMAAAARAYAERGGTGTVVVASGGRRWAGAVEADVMSRAMRSLGVPEQAIVRERCSLSTKENARFAAAALARHGATGSAPLAVVTCDWHLPRALAAFRRAGLEAVGVPAPSPPVPWSRRLWRRSRERVLRWALPWAWLVLSACSRRPAPARAVDAGTTAATAQAPDPLPAIEKAEDERRAADVPAEAQRSHDPAVRRRAARAFARILDGDDAPLLRALDDDEDEVVAWGAYGLGESCRGHEESHVRALAARLASLQASRPRSDRIDSRISILRALGRCGGDVAEQTLRAWLRRADAAPPGATLEAAAYALGDAASRRGSLAPESSRALLEAAQRTPPLDAALYAFGRVEGGAGDDLSARLLAAARAALARPGPSRFFAVRALGRTGTDAAANLARVLRSADFTPPERAEAARALARLGAAGQQALAGALPALVPADAGAPTADAHGILLTALQSLSENAPKDADATLWAVTRLAPPAGSAPALSPSSRGPSPATARRLSQLRCAAALRLARGAWDSDVLRTCDVADGEAGETARLAALDRGELGPARRAARAAWMELAHAKHLRVREAALEAVERHPELGDAALPVLAEALSAAEPGVVATAADVVHAHPERVYVLAASERRAALDPRAPPPTANPARELDAGVARGLRAAMARPWGEDLVETRASLLDAALAVGIDEGRAFALAACKDANATLRARAAKALAAAGDKDARCPAHAEARAPAPEIEAPLAQPTRVVFDTDAGVLGIRFDPALAPVAATRFVALARSGFYTGIAVHRVVPGFVVQLGDRGGDGYGGSGQSLRCETSPVPFGPLDVGVALAGRDTGSSQIFVTLARTPHLDGEYAWVGHADGDWNAVAEGDLVRSVRVEP